MHRGSFLAAALTVAIVGTVGWLYLLDQSRTTVNENEAVRQNNGPLNPGSSDKHAEPMDEVDGQEAVEQLVESVYDFDLDYREKAVKAAEDRMQHYDRESYLRWEPVRIDPDLHLKGSFIEKGAMPTSIAISPFSDVTIVADQIDYHVMEHVQSAIWTGSIRGTENGRVEISIVGGESNPGFIVRFLNYPNLISIQPSDDSGEYYIAVEGNPHQQLANEH